MDLIDAAGDTPGAEDDEEEEDDELAAQRPGVGPPKAESGQDPAPRSQGQGPGTGSGDTYRPKRPTTLNLFPQVPRSQVRREQPWAGRGGGALGGQGRWRGAGLLVMPGIQARYAWGGTGFLQGGVEKGLDRKVCPGKD